ncbi:hypothetical protein U27_03681 [Candidatus Vecturithrix granuli]|uniref:Uncharacterized protein n=1 Tax=Vecturithrix granuli TaxID=1499967 RepID=A0A081BWL3_VECG1|nr:hypothetical protein U27_03681 [Candidatus Vecturithrix granuli]
METTHQHSFFNDYCIGLSISESPDLPALGLNEIHLQDAMVEFARYLLASGSSLAYGGDLRAGGFTETLFKLVQANNQQGLPPYKRVITFLAWPIHLNLPIRQKAELKGVADFRPLDPPTDLQINPTEFLHPNSAENSYIWARCLTVMREKMSLETDARLLLGGRLTGYKGKYPGLIEEAFICLHDEKPLFLLGGFGGCAKAVIDAMHGAHPEPLTTAYQIAQNPGYEEFMAYYNAQVKEHPETGQEPIDYDALVAFFQQEGVAGLHNGLNLEENERLFATPHIPEMISLVLKGLSRLSENM